MSVVQVQAAEVVVQGTRSINFVIGQILNILIGRQGVGFVRGEVRLDNERRA